MGKNKIPIVFFMFLLVCGGLFAQNVSLSQAVQTSAKAIESRLPQGAKVAVLAFTSTSQAFSDFMIGELATVLTAGRKQQIIEREFTDAIRRELNIQMSGDVSDSEVRRIGQQLGAQYVVTGSLVDVGNSYRLTVAAINVESAVREASSSVNININDPQAVFLVTGERAVETRTTAVTASSFVGSWRMGSYELIVNNKLEYVYKEKGVNSTMGHITFTADYFTLNDTSAWNGSRWVSTHATSGTFGYTLNGNVLILFNNTVWAFLNGTWTRK